MVRISWPMYNHVRSGEEPSGSVSMLLHAYRGMDMSHEHVTASLWHKDDLVLAMLSPSDKLCEALGRACPVSRSSRCRNTVLRDRSKLFESHWSNQWLTSKIELLYITLRPSAAPSLRSEW